MKNEERIKAINAFVAGKTTDEIAESLEKKPEVVEKYLLFNSLQLPMCSEKRVTF